MTKTRIGSLFFLVFSAFYFYKSYSIHLLAGANYDAMNARTFPFYLGIFGIGISTLMFILTFIKFDKNDLFDFVALKSYNFKKGLYFILDMIFYGLTIRTLGFTISTILFLIIGFLIMGARNKKVILLTSFGISIIFWLLLTQVLGVYVEQGIVLDYLLGVQS